ENASALPQLENRQDTTDDLRGDRHQLETAPVAQCCMKILITGVCGFVGSALAECLLERVEGIRVAGIDNLMRSGVETNRMRIERIGVGVIQRVLRSAWVPANLPVWDWV